MTQQEFKGDRRGVSPVIGIILVVALATIIAASVGSYALGTYDRNATPAPSVGFTADYDDVDTLTINHESGDAFEGSEVHFVRQSGSGTSTLPAQWGTDTVRSGDSIPLSGVASDDVILVVWEDPVEGGKSVILYTWRGSEA
jgi:FlaG/FlaF family flagellin (archaellin)